jgi:Bifunctional DNA primase/polymerase, N-terminal/Primase C terminal 1 (PriCT-1)
MTKLLGLESLACGDRLPRLALLGLRRPRSGIFLGGFGLPLAVKCSGRQSAPGCAVIDPRKGGAEALASLESKHGKLPETLTADTGGGGVHHLFKYPGFPVKNSTGELGPGLDIKGDTLTSLAGTMRRRGMGAEEIEAALFVTNTMRCNPPLAEDKVRKIAAGVCRYKPVEASVLRHKRSR